MHLTQVAFMALLLLSLTAAAARGGPAERTGAAMLFVAALATPVVQTEWFEHIEWGVAAVDTVLLFGLTALAKNTDRRWPSFAAAFQALAVFTHVARMRSGDVAGDAYGHLVVLWSYPVLLALLWGSLVENRRVSHAGDRDHAAANLYAISNGSGAMPKRRPINATNDLELLTQLLSLHGFGGESGDVAARLLARTGSYAAAVATPPSRLRDWGIDVRVANALAFSRNSTKLTLRRRLENRVLLDDQRAVFDYLHAELADQDREQFRVLYLNARFRLILDDVHGEGSVTTAPVFPREIAKRAIELGAMHIILAHNHPSGDPAPSRADIATTRAVIDAVRGVGISVIDHIIIGTSGHTSFRSSGLL